MIDAKNIENLRKLAQSQRDIADRYAKARELSGKAETDLKIIVASKINEMRKEKKNIGIEMAVLSIIDSDSVAKGLYEEWHKNEAIYKGLERVLDANGSSLIFEQSLMKFVKDGERFS